MTVTRNMHNSLDGLNRIVVLIFAREVNGELIQVAHSTRAGLPGCV
jgi:hypothetical protein